MNVFSSKKHWKFFAEFCCLEQASGGPDPQISMVGEMGRGCGLDELIWRGGCYIAVYNVPFAEVLWSNWPWDRRREGLERWLWKHWGGIVTRFERRCVRRSDWMLEFLVGYARWQSDVFSGLREETAALTPEERYERFWTSVLTVPRLGRYVALKLLEYFKRCCNIELEAPDIRPRGGWSPRETLALLYPDLRQDLLAGDTSEDHLAVHKVVDNTRLKLRDRFLVDVDYFQLQVMLCEYRESCEGKRQYPGRSLDSELGYALKADKLWKHTSDIWRARERLFPRFHLGEHNSWSGPRKELGVVLSKYLYTWSDLRYDYAETARLGNWKVPVVRS